MLGRGVGNPATGAQGGDYPSWGEEQQQGWKQEGTPATYSAEGQEGLGVGLEPGYNAPGYDDGDVPIDASDQYLAVDDGERPAAYAQEDAYEDEQEDAYEDDSAAYDDPDDGWDDEI